jgi:hypothetical protein
MDKIMSDRIANDPNLLRLLAKELREKAVRAEANAQFMERQNIQEGVGFKLEYHADITKTANYKPCNPVILSDSNLGKVIIANLSQDLDQVDSDHHFDNCCFEEGAKYIEGEWKNVQAQADKLSDNGLAAFGRLLHTVQDFYAHSNWVEIHQFYDPIPVWDLDVRNLPYGIMSGTWFIGHPKKCNSSVPPHTKLNKDDPNSEEGQKIVATGPNKGKTLFSLARESAIRATLIQFEQLKKLVARPLIS